MHEIKRKIIPYAIKCKQQKGCAGITVYCFNNTSHREKVYITFLKNLNRHIFIAFVTFKYVCFAFEGLLSRTE